MRSFLKILIVTTFSLACANSGYHEGTQESQLNEPADTIVKEKGRAVKESKKDTTASRGLENLIEIIEPKKNEDLSSPVLVRGRARGYWFFEGDFPIEIRSENGETLAQGVAIAKGQWMTEDWVEFSADLQFEVDEKQPASMIFHKQNASGDSEKAKKYVLPVNLSPAKG